MSEWWEHAPAWPEIRIRRLPDHDQWVEPGKEVWGGATDTGRPKTPTYIRYVAFSSGLTESDAHHILQWMIENDYKKAHPHGCPESHAMEGVKLNHEPKELPWPHRSTSSLNDTTDPSPE